MREALDKLQKENLALRQRVEALESLLAKSQAENQELKQKNAWLIKQVFGRSSEKLDPRQIEFALGLAAAEIAETPKVIVFPVSTHRKLKKRNKPRIPDNTPTEDVIIDPEEVKQAPQNYRLIGQEITQELDVIPPIYIRRRYIRRKYTNILNRALAPVIADLPPRLIEGGYAGAGLLTDIILKKYVDHLPLYRQEQILRNRFGIDLPRKTMCDWVWKVADWLKPVYNHIYDELREGGYLQIDETPVRYCQAEGGGSAQGYFWVYHRPGVGVLYEWHTGRGADCLKSMLDGFVGTVQSDGYGAYGSYAKDSNRLEKTAGRPAAIELAACWAHARRKVYEAREEKPVLAGWLLHQIGLMYRVEEELRNRKAGPQLRQAVRKSQTNMMLSRIQKVMNRKISSLLPQSQLGAAFRYTLGLWNELLRFRDDGRLEIDNNLVENAIRPTAIGKKNWLFIGNPEAGDRSAIIYTLLENCKRLGINPQDYLLDVLTRLPTMTNQHTKELTPSNWLERRKAKVA
jgi:transposase